MKRTPSEIFWDTLYRGYYRQALPRSAKYFAGKVDWLHRHGVTESCALVAAQRAVPPDVGAMIAADMAAARERAERSKGAGSHRNMAWNAAAGVAILVGLVIYDAVRYLYRNVEHGEPWLGNLAEWLIMIGLVVLMGVYSWGMAAAEVRLLDRILADWAARLDGKHGTDTLDEVVAWLEARWAWLLPPNLFANDVLWVIGSRRGVPVLVVLERITGTITRNVMVGAAARTRRNEKAPGGWWTRTNIFLQGARFRDAAHEERVQKAIARIGGGAVQCPSGVYLYGVFGFDRFLREEGPTSEIWIDLVDKVIDPDFQGSESAAKELQQELVFLGLATPEGKLDA